MRMSANLLGLWRLVIVLYGAATLITLVAVGTNEYESYECRASNASIKKARDMGFDLRPGAFDSANYGLEENCTSGGHTTLLGFGALAAEAVIIFGGALVIRWVYRGFRTRS